MAFENESKIVINYWFASEIFKIYICDCKNGLVTYFPFTDDLIFMFEIKILILKNELKMNYSYRNEF